MTFPILQLLFNSLITGSIYSLVAVGFSLIYATNRFMHFAHGVSVVAASYILFTLFNLLGINFWISCLLTILIAGGIGVLIYKFLYDPLKKRNSSNVILLISSIALLILIENIILLLFGANVKSIGYFEVSKGLELLGAVITPLQIVIILISIILLMGLYLFMNKTILGRNIRAVADQKELAAIMGLNTERLMTIAFFIGSLLAGVAGVLVGIEQNMTPTMGTNLMIKGFSGAVIGGILSVPGAVVGSYIVGIAENFGTWFLPSGFKDAITFGLLFLFLLFKPQGIFGRNKGVKK